MLMLALRSHKAFSKKEFPIVQCIVKLPGSFSLGDSLFSRVALHSSFSVSCSSSLLLFCRISFMNLACFSIFANASVKEILICNFLNMFKKWANCLSVLFSPYLWGNDSGGTHALIVGFFAEFGGFPESTVFRRVIIFFVLAEFSLALWICFFCVLLMWYFYSGLLVLLQCFATP